MYKRPARVVFFCDSQTECLLIAAAYAEAYGAAYMDIRIVGQTGVASALETTSSLLTADDVQLASLNLEPVSEELLTWADLWITLMGKEIVEPARLRLNHVRHKHWHLERSTETLPNIGGTNVIPQIQFSIKRKVKSMINGMKMLEKSSW